MKKLTNVFFLIVILFFLCGTFFHTTDSSYRKVRPYLRGESASEVGNITRGFKIDPSLKESRRSITSEDEDNPHSLFDKIGIIPEHGSHGGVPEEHIDLFSGGLTLKYKDIHLPGPNGFDLVVWRIYNSKLYRDKYAPSDFPSGWDMQQSAVSWLGFGWKMHMGRVYNFNPDEFAYPVIEFPDGRTETAYPIKGGSVISDRIYVTKSYLRYDKNSHTLHFRDGTVWYFGQPKAVLTNYVRASVCRVVTEIRSPQGYTINIDYYDELFNPCMEKITDSMGREVHFVMTSIEDGDSNNNRLKRIWFENEKGDIPGEPPGITNYYYTVEEFTGNNNNGYYKLVSFEPPEIAPTIYEYDEVSRELTEVNTGYGGRLSYEYEFQDFYYYSGKRLSAYGYQGTDNEYYLQTRVVKKKKIRFTALLTSEKTWIYNYPDYYDEWDSDAPVDRTVKVEGPEFDTHVTHHILHTLEPWEEGYDETTSTLVDYWKSGLIEKKWVTPKNGGQAIYSEDYTWDGYEISDYTDLFCGGELGLTKTPAIAPLQRKITRTKKGDAPEVTEYWYREIEADTGIIIRDLYEYGVPADVVTFVNGGIENLKQMEYCFEGETGVNSPFTDHYMLSLVKKETVWDCHNFWETWLVGKETIYDYYNAPLDADKNFGEVKEIKRLKEGDTYLTWIYGYSGANPETVTKTIDPPGNAGIETYIYRYGVLAEKIRPGFTEFTRNICEKNSAILSETNQHGGTISFAYDDLLRITGIELPSPFNAITATWKQNNVTIKQGGYTLSKYWDGMGRDTGYSESGSIGVGGTLLLYYWKTLDAEGRVIRETRGSTSPDHAYNYEYNAAGQVTIITDPREMTTTFVYSGNQKTVTDANTNQTIFTYEGLPGLVSQLTDVYGKTTSYQYDALGRLIWVTQSDNLRKHTYAYNSLDQVFYEEHPETGSMNYSYNTENLLAFKAWGGNTAAYTYNSSNQLLTFTSGNESGDEAITYEYFTNNPTDNGTLKKISSNKGWYREIIEYNDLGAITRETQLIPGIGEKTTHYFYDSYNNLESIRYPSNRQVDYIHNGLNLPKTLSFNGKSLVSRIDYGLQKKPTYLVISGNNTNITTTYKAGIGLLESLKMSKGLSTHYYAKYGYDNLGNITSISNTKPHLDANFVYDKLNRLESASYSGGKSYSYTYDDFGNMLTAVENGLTVFQRTYTGKNQVDSTDHGYDSRGNLTQAPGYTYTWDKQNQLQEVKNSSGETVGNYLYNERGLRLKATRPLGGSGGMTVIRPNGGERWLRGASYIIAWQSNGSLGYVNIEYSTDGGINYTPIISATEDDCIFTWLVPDTLSDTCQVRVSGTSGEPYDVSDAVFSIVSENGDPPDYTSSVVSPAPGANWATNSSNDVIWDNTQLNGTHVKIELVPAAAAGSATILSSITIIDSTENDGTFAWTIPPTVSSGDYKIRISDVDNTENYIDSNIFSISASAPENPLEKISEGPVVSDGGNSEGVSWADYDNDGDLDLFVANAGGEDNCLYQNNGDGTFSKVSDGPVVSDGGDSHSGAWGDYDNDGCPDLFVTNYNEDNFLYHNNGDGSFSKITGQVVGNDGGNSLSCAWVDYDNNGYLDMFVVNRDEKNCLYRNNGDNTFTKLSANPVVEEQSDSLFGTWGDYDNDGYPDLFVANWDGENNFLYHNDGNGRFTRVSEGPVVTDGGNSYSGSWGDYDNDGDLDLFVANFAENNNLYQNNGDGTFTKMTEGQPVADEGNSCGSAWGDYDNDGDLDLFVANQDGYNFLYQNNGGDLVRVTEGAINEDFADSVGAAWADFNNDGSLDLVVANQNGEDNYLYQNSGNANDWIRIRCEGVYSNRSAIGAGIFVKKTGSETLGLREISGQSGFGGQNSLLQELGLGGAETIEEIRVEWPSGIIQTLDNVDPNQTLVITESVTGQVPEMTVLQDTVPVLSGSVFEFDSLEVGNETDVTFTIKNIGTSNLTLDGSPPVVISGTDAADFSVLQQPGDTVNPGETSQFTIRFSPDLLGTKAALVSIANNDGDENPYEITLSANIAASGSRLSRITSGEIVTDLNVSSGCSWGDYDNDGFADLFVTNASGGNNALYHNNGDGTFSKITSGPPVTDGGESYTSSWGDYDNDGSLDLFAANYGQNNFLYHNNGDGTFTKVTSGAIAADGGLSTGASWVDYDADGNLDLFVLNANQANFLYRNHGNGTFEKITEDPIVTSTSSSSACAWGDYDNDGYPDLFIANSSSVNHLYHNNGDGTFNKIEESPFTGDYFGSYSASWGDYDNDGHLDLFVANHGDNYLYRNNGDNTFTKIIDGSIVNDGGISKGSTWGDFDSDGDLDLFVANTDPDHTTNSCLYINNGDGTFGKVTDGPLATDSAHSISAAWCDIDADGDLDLFVANYSGAESNFLYLNTGYFNNWININCIGKEANTSAIGTRIKVKAGINGMSTWQIREISGQTGNKAQDCMTASFGLGNAPIIEEIRVEWPSGNMQTLNNIPVNQNLSVTEANSAQASEISIKQDAANISNGTSFDIGSIEEGQTKDTGFTIHNIGTLDLILGGTPPLEISGENAGSFSIIQEPGSPVSPQGTTSFTIRFSPGFSGFKRATLSIDNNDPDENPFQFEVTGTATVNETQLVPAASGSIVTDSTASNGCSWGDYDNDGFPDLFISNWHGENNCIYHNNGDGSFSKITGGPVVTDGGFSTGGVWGDYDNDGYPDLFVSNSEYGHDFLYHNNGDGTFSKVTTGSIVTTSNDAIGAAWGDYDNDGRLDLFVVDRSWEDYLYRNEISGEFTRITTGPLGSETGYSYGAAWCDYDNDGDLDLLVTTTTNNSLYVNNGDGSFTKATSGVIVTDPGNSRGVSWGDYDNDGYQDLFVTNFDEPNFLYHNEGDGTFTKITTGAIVTDIGKSRGSTWGDFDNDGDLDIFVANRDEHNSMYRNEGEGYFSRVTGGAVVSDVSDSIGCAASDFDHDGDLDLVVANSEQNNLLFINAGNGNHWLHITCIGSNSNRSAIGSKVKVKAFIDGAAVWQMREISGQSGNMSQNDMAAHFGLKDAGIVDEIRIEWPSGNVSTLNDVPVNQGLTINEPETEGIIVTSPIGGESWQAGSTRDITWTSTGVIGNVKIEYSIDNGTTYTTIVDSTENNGLYEWLIPDTPSAQCLVRISDTGGSSVEDTSPATFSIIYVTATSFTPVSNGAIVTDAEVSRSCSWGDYNNDGYPDLFVCNTTGCPNSLYQNNGDGTFTRITSGSIVTDSAASQSGSWGDYDNDGYPDLFVANNGQNNFLYRNNGDSTFTRITSGAIVSDGGASMGAAWGDYDNDGCLDLFVANKNQNNFLYRNNGDGSFTKVTSGDIVSNGGYSTCCTWGDYDNDGYIDLYVSNYSDQKNFLYKNNGDGSFTKITTGPPVANNNSAGGSSWGDYDRDGDLDLFVTIDGADNVLYRNNGDSTFTEITDGPVVNDGGASRGSVWVDFDNDGDLDLFVANRNENNFLYRNDGNDSFSKIVDGPIVNDGGESLGSALADYDNDGDTDLFVANYNQANFLYRNDGNANNWIEIKCKGTNSNSSGIGTRVKVKVSIHGLIVQQMHELSGQTGMYGQNSIIAHFGLANAALIDDIRIEWPSGCVTTLSDVSPNQVLTITEPEAEGITVVSPNGGESWQVGFTRDITWTNTGTVGNVKIEYSIDNGTTYTTIVDSTENNGTYQWLIPDTVSSSCLVRIGEVNGDLSDLSDAVFSIVSAPAAAISITYPVGGESFQVGSNQTITWTSTGVIDNVKIEYSTDNGTNYTTIVDSTVNDGSYQWLIPDTPSDQCLVRISDTGSSAQDTGPANFSIISIPAVSFTRVSTGSIVTDAEVSRSCSWGDYNNDGYPDLFICNTTGCSNSLYQNNGDGTFTRITSGSIVTDSAASQSGSWGDYDNDGYPDLFVANNGQDNYLYRNNGDSTFTKITSGEIVTNGGASMSASWGDYDNDGYLDMFVANKSQNNFLYKNNGDGSFTKISSGDIVSNGGDSRCCTWGDYDNDGYIDLYVANYSNQNNFMYRNNGDGSFTRITSGAVVTDTGYNLGSSWGDYDRDGDLDLFVTIDGADNVLYRNNGDGSFYKITSGTLVSDGGASRGSVWVDFDNDGDLDLFVVNRNENNFLYRNDGNDGFTKIEDGAIVSDGGESLGCTRVDYDNDGDTDLFVANYNEVNFLYRNDGNANNWIAIKCKGTGSNASAIGARVKVTAAINGLTVQQMQELSGQTGMYGQDDMRAHFGLGNAALIDNIQIEWPSGYVTTLSDVSPNQGLTITELEADGITVTSPNGDESWQVGSTRDITWTSTGTVGNVKIEYSIDNGSTYSTIIDSTENNGSYQWLVPDTVSSSCLVRISEVDGDPSDVSDAVFSIVSAPAAAISITSPVGGESFQVGSTRDITWTSTGVIDNVKIEYSTDSGTTYTTIVDSTVNDGSYEWLIPDNPSDQCLVRISDTGGSSAQDTSPAAFSIISIPAASFTRVSTGSIATDAEVSRSCSWGDYDNDGYPDLFICNITGCSNSLYQNNGDGTFTKITSGSIVTDSATSQSSSWGDYDNDGYLDIFVANNGQNNFLYRNNGDNTFTKITSGDIVTNGGASLSAAWGDYDNDGFLDMFVANKNQNNFLYRNNGDGSFTKVTSGDIVSNGGWSTCCTWGDYDNDGYIDLYVANYSNQKNFLYKNNGDSTFTKITTGPPMANNNSALGSSWGDYDRDGHLDLFVTIDGADNVLYRNNGDSTFTEITDGPMVSDGGASRGGAWVDFDNDGDLDLFVVNRNQDNFLYRNDGNDSFTKIEEGAIVSDGGDSLGCTRVDYDNDGDTDLFVANYNEVNFLYQNEGNANNWIAIKCKGTDSNASAIGARVKVTAAINGQSVQQMQELSGQTGMYGQNSIIAHFGLGNAALIDEIRIEWSSGQISNFIDVDVNQFLTIDEETGIISETARIQSPKWRSDKNNRSSDPTQPADDPGMLTQAATYPGPAEFDDFADLENRRGPNIGRGSFSSQAVGGTTTVPQTGRARTNSVSTPLTTQYVNTYYIYSFDGRLLAEYDDSDNCVKEYIYVGSKLLAEYNPQTGQYYYYTTDQINSTRIVTDDNGDVVYSAAHGPYGGMQKIWAKTVTPHPEFSGKERESQTQLDYFGARYYDHRSYRFISTDPIINKEEALENPQLWNLYAYCHSNPVTYLDPDGRNPIAIIFGINFVRGLAPGPPPPTPGGYLGYAVQKVIKHAIYPLLKGSRETMLEYFELVETENEKALASIPKLKTAIEGIEKDLSSSIDIPAEVRSGLKQALKQHKHDFKINSSARERRLKLRKSLKMRIEKLSKPDAIEKFLDDVFN